MRGQIFSAITLILLSSSASARGNESSVVRTGFSGSIGTGPTFVNLNGNTFFAPEVRLSLGGQWHSGAAYGFFSGATGQIPSTLRVTMFSVGGMWEFFLFDRVRIGIGIEHYLWFLSGLVTRDDISPKLIGLTAMAQVSADIYQGQDSIPDVFLSVGGRGGLFGDGVELGALFAYAGIRW